ncbi:MAG: type II secretion system inner membrane protein GspF [Deltaproteobacteria bacterium]|nr:type II secretion system inner membrane protein GspF [Deltaproteobacteria bacterium]
MPVFEYRAVDRKGKKVKGLITAEGASAARLKLSQDLIFPVAVTEVERPEKTTPLGRLVRWRGINPVEVSTSLRQLATLVSSGLPLVDCLAGLIEQTENASLKRVFTQIREKVVEGEALSRAMAGHPQVFSPIHMNMVRAAEAGGALDLILKRLADFSEKRLKLKKKIESAMTYPIFLLFISSVILLFLMSFVMPKVITIFKGMKLALPWSTRALIWITQGISQYWWLLLAGVALLIGLCAVGIRTEKGRNLWHRLRLAAPVLGKIHHKAVIARFTRTLSILLRSGVPLVQAIGIARASMGNRVMESVMEETERLVAEGASFSDPLRKRALFPPLVVQLVRAGEQSGEMEEMLTRAAEVYEDDVETAMGSLTSIMEPLVILAMGLIVGFIVMAVLVPIFDMTKGIK